MVVDSVREPNSIVTQEAEENAEKVCKEKHTETSIHHLPAEMLAINMPDLPVHQPHVTAEPSTSQTTRDKDDQICNKNNVGLQTNINETNGIITMQRNGVANAKKDEKNKSKKKSPTESFETSELVKTKDLQKNLKKKYSRDFTSLLFLEVFPRFCPAQFVCFSEVPSGPI